MKLTASGKKTLEPGIHPVTIKSITAVKGPTGQPASWPDPANDNKPTGAVKVLYMGKNGFGIEDNFWLAKAHLHKLESLFAAIGLQATADRKIDPEVDCKGKKLWLAVSKILVFNPGMVPALGSDGTQLYYGKAMKKFWAISKEMPKMEGNPLDNDGVASGDFLWHECEGKIFKPAPVELSNSITTVRSMTVDEIKRQFPLTEKEAKALENIASNNRPVGAHELRMKSRCERCEALGLVYANGAYTGIISGMPVLILDADLVNTVDDVFDKHMKGLETDIRTDFRLKQLLEMGMTLDIVNKAYVKDGFIINDLEILNDSENVFAGKISDIQIEMKRRTNDLTNTHYGAGVQQLVSNNLTAEQLKPLTHEECDLNRKPSEIKTHIGTESILADSTKNVAVRSGRIDSDNEGNPIFVETYVELPKAKPAFGVIASKPDHIQQAEAYRELTKDTEIEPITKKPFGV